MSAFRISEDAHNDLLRAHGLAALMGQGMEAMTLTPGDPINPEHIASCLFTISEMLHRVLKTARWDAKADALEVQP